MIACLIGAAAALVLLAAVITLFVAGCWAWDSRTARRRARYLAAITGRTCGGE